MNKNIKKTIALALTLSAFSTISSLTPGTAFDFTAKPVYAASYKASNGELSSLKVKSTNGDTLDLKDGYYGEIVKLNDDKEYYVRLTDDSDGIKINAEVKGSDKVIRIFLSNDSDAKAYNVADKLPLGKGNTTVYVRTYDSISDFRNAKDKKKDVTICEEEYVINVKKTTGSSYEDDSQDSIYLSSIELNKGDITFLKQRTSYDIKVSSSVDEIRITAKPEESDSRVRINGSLVDDGDNYRKTISLKKGKNEIKIKVTDNKDNQRTYTLNVTRGSSSSSDNQDEIYLNNIELSEGKIDFSYDECSYKLDVLNDVSKITITAEPEDEEFLVTIDGDEVNSGDDYKKKVSLKEGKNTIPVVVEDEVNDQKRTYTLTINRKESAKVEEVGQVTDNNSAKEGWVKNGDDWQYKDVNGKILKNQWLYDENEKVYCFLKEDGYRATGWFKNNDKWYLLDSKGAMLTGWQYTNGKWYYLNTDGSMKSGWFKEEEEVTVNTDNKTNTTGNNVEKEATTKTEATKTTKVETWYYLNADGSMHTGWLDCGKWYYFNTSGAMQTGWVIDSGSKYYLNADGSMQLEAKTINGKTYKFTKSGAVII